MWLFIHVSLELNCTNPPPPTPKQSQTLKTNTTPLSKIFKKKALKEIFQVPGNQEQHLQQKIIEKFTSLGCQNVSNTQSKNMFRTAAITKSFPDRGPHL